MNPLKALSAVFGLCVSLPIWLYLQYKILEMEGASELMWFLFWVYVPATCLASLLMRLAEANTK